MDPRVFIAAFALVFSLCFRADAQLLELGNSGSRRGAPGTTMGTGHFKIDVAKIPTKLSSDPARGGPLALTRDRAVALAREAAAKEGLTDLPERYIKVTFVEGHVIGTQDQVPAGACLWYYLVEFNEARKGAVLYAVLLNEIVLKEF